MLTLLYSHCTKQSLKNHTPCLLAGVGRYGDWEERAIWFGPRLLLFWAVLPGSLALSGTGEGSLKLASKAETLVIWRNPTLLDKPPVLAKP